MSSLCGLFIWKGDLDTARVSWDVVTKEQEHGGLEIKDLYTWNRTCTLKMIWLLFFQSGSVWVEWFRTEILTDKLSNFWTAKPNMHNSWLSNKLLKIKSIVFTLFKLRIGNGQTCRFWSDNWYPNGVVSDLILEVRGSCLGIRREATIAFLYREGGWLLPSPRSDQQLNIIAFLTNITLSYEEDFYEWELEGKVITKYYIGLVYRKLKGPQQTLPYKSHLDHRGYTEAQGPRMVVCLE